MRINAIAAYIVIKASSGKKTFPKVSIKPMSSEPTKAPFKLPGHPTTTTISVKTRTSISIPASTPTIGATVTPARPASPQPNEKL